MDYSKLNTVVIKAGTEVVTTPDGLPDPEIIASIARQVVEAKRQIPRIAIVSSGAVAAGRAEYGTVRSAEESMELKQAYASAGQAMFAEEWRRPLHARGHVANMMLLTRRAIDSRMSHRHIRNAMEQTFSMGKPSVPIINENDTESTDELRFTDNDQLAAYVARMIKAQVVIILTNVPGVMRDMHDPGQGIISEVPVGSKEWEQFVKPGTSGNGRGGMHNKCRIGRRLARSGISTVIASGREPDVVKRILLGNEALGTRFSA